MLWYAVFFVSNWKWTSRENVLQVMIPHAPWWEAAGDSTSNLGKLFYIEQHNNASPITETKTHFKGVFPMRISGGPERYLFVAISFFNSTILHSVKYHTRTLPWFLKTKITLDEMPYGNSWKQTVPWFPFFSANNNTYNWKLCDSSWRQRMLKLVLYAGVKVLNIPLIPLHSTILIHTDKVAPSVHVSGRTKQAPVTLTSTHCLKELSVFIPLQNWWDSLNLFEKKKVITYTKLKSNLNHFCFLFTL